MYFVNPDKKKYLDNIHTTTLEQFLRSATEEREKQNKIYSFYFNLINKSKSCLMNRKMSSKSQKKEKSESCTNVILNPILDKSKNSVSV